MFSRLYSRILSTASLRTQCCKESTEIGAKCPSSNHAPLQPHVKHPRKGLKCSVGVLFLQRQFMRNFCLLQQKDVAQQNGLEPTALQPKQQKFGSPVLSSFSLNLRNSNSGITQESPLFDTQQSSSQHHVLPLYQNVPPYHRGVFGCANTKAFSDNHPYNKHLSDDIQRRLYSSSTDQKESEKLPDKGTSQDALKKQNILTIPNGLTMSRICLTPLLGYLVVQESFPLACGLFLFAGLTDLVDGYIARRFPSQISAFGSFLDPLADKILISVLFVSLTFVKLIPLSLAILVIGRDIGLIVAAFYIRYISLNPPITFKRFFDATYASAQLQPMMISKMNTMLQLGLVTVSLAAPVFGYVDHILLHYLWYLTAFTTTVSGIGYLFAKDTFKILQQKRSGPK